MFLKRGWKFSAEKLLATLVEIVRFPTVSQRSSPYIRSFPTPNYELAGHRRPEANPNCAERSRGCPITAVRRPGNPICPGTFKPFQFVQPLENFCNTVPLDPATQFRSSPAPHGGGLRGRVWVFFVDLGTVAKFVSRITLTPNLDSVFPLGKANNWWWNKSCPLNEIRKNNKPAHTNFLLLMQWSDGGWSKSRPGRENSDKLPPTSVPFPFLGGFPLPFGP